jgi:hypothetical protein
MSVEMILTNARIVTADARSFLRHDTGKYDLRAAAREKLAKISGEPKLVKSPKERRTLLDLLMGDVSSFLPFNSNIGDTRIQFSYLWK